MKRITLLSLSLIAETMSVYAHSNFEEVLIKKANQKLQALLKQGENAISEEDARKHMLELMSLQHDFCIDEKGNLIDSDSSETNQTCRNIVAATREAHEKWLKLEQSVNNLHK